MPTELFAPIHPVSYFHRRPKRGNVDPRKEDGPVVTVRSRSSEVSAMAERVVSVLAQVFEVSVFVFAAAALAVGAITLR